MRERERVEQRHSRSLSKMDPDGHEALFSAFAEYVETIVNCASK